MQPLFMQPVTLPTGPSLGALVLLESQAPGHACPVYKLGILAVAVGQHHKIV